MQRSRSRRRHWLPLLAVAAGCHPAPDAATPAVTMTDITARSGLPGSSDPCLALSDLDGDGRPDVLAAPTDANTKFLGKLSIQLNKGGGKFEHHDSPVAVTDVSACALGDVDNDGRPDLVLSSDSTQYAVTLLMNHVDSGMGFVRASDLVASGVTGGRVSALAFIDYDADGLLDLVVGTFTHVQYPVHCQHEPTRVPCYQVNPMPATSGLLLHNDGGGHFSPSTKFTMPPQYVNSIQVLDWDGDGWTDIFLSDDFGVNRLLKNDKNGGFTDILPGMVFNNGMGAAFADYDGDGRLDMYNTEMGPDQLLYGRADGSLEDGAARAGVIDNTRLHVGWSPFAGDFNLDGQVDIFVANNGEARDAAGLDQIATGMLADGTTGPDYLFLGQGAGQFAFQKLPAHRASFVDPLASAVADFDGDGYLDVIETASFQPLRLLRNDSLNPNGHWLGVRLVGHKSNHDGLGATVALLDGGKPWQQRVAGLSGLGTSSPVVHFGLGGKTSFGGILIRWPGDHEQMVSAPSAVDRVITIDEQ